MTDFPKHLRYEMIVEGKATWLSLENAGQAFGLQSPPARIGGLVLEATSITREITNPEISQIAAFSANQSTGDN